MTDEERRLAVWAVWRASRGMVAAATPTPSQWCAAHKRARVTRAIRRVEAACARLDRRNAP